LRVSADKQGRSGLGLEAQREAVAAYLNGGRWTLVAEYVETESGKRADRAKLGATLVFAKLDRLTRNVDLLRALVASEVDLLFCDLPSVPPGAMGRFLLTQMASVAELEAGIERAKVKGTKFGRPAALDASQRRKIAERYAAGETMAELARDYECGDATIWRALQG
jgi:DNA invertase Pin-like site-specific DNA recombinase